MHIKLLSLLLFSLNSTSMVIIDVRTEDEWKNGHLDGAVNIEWQDILKISIYH
jgi:rhodanese-related sulfurtransferase